MNRSIVSEMKWNFRESSAKNHEEEQFYVIVLAVERFKMI
jgi:hypothetical protein